MSTDAPSSCGRGGARKKEESVPTGLRSRPCSAAAKDVGILNREICGGQITGDFQTASYLLQQTIFEYTAALNSMRDGPMGHGLAAVMGAVLTGIRGMLFVYFLLYVLWLSSLRSVRSCGGRHGPGSRLACLGCPFLGIGF